MSDHRTDEASSAEVLTFGAMIGANVRSLREAAGLTQQELWSRCADNGLGWPRTRLVHLEKGRVKDVTLSELVVLGAALQVQMSALLDGIDEVLLPNGEVVCRGQDVQGWLGGGPPVGISRATPKEMPPIVELRRYHPLERDLASRLGVDYRLIHLWALEMFGQALDAERDARVREEFGEVSKQERTARRGHVARTLAREVEAELKRRGEI